MGKKLSFLCFTVLLFISGCANGEGARATQTIHVASASDLYHALTEMGEEFTEETDVEVEFTFGSTGLLTQQVQQGAPFDLFIAAHESYIDRLIAENVVMAESKQYYAHGRTVIMGRKEDGDKLDHQDLLSPEVETVTIANPEHAPYGKAAKEALETWGMWEDIQPKLVYAENIRQAYQYVESKNADAGIIALALMYETDMPYEIIDQNQHEPIRQALAIPVQTEKEELSQMFSDFLLSERGQEILKKYGFDLP